MNIDVLDQLDSNLESRLTKTDITVTHDRFPSRATSNMEKYRVYQNSDNINRKDDTARMRRDHVRMQADAMYEIKKQSALFK